MRRPWWLVRLLSVLALAVFPFLAPSATFAKDGRLDSPPRAADPESGDPPTAGASGFPAIAPAPSAPLNEPMPSSAGRKDSAAEAETAASSAPGQPHEKAAPLAPNPAEDREQHALPAVNAAIKSALEARSILPDRPGFPCRREREAILSFYASRNFAPLWWEDGKPAPETAPVIERLRRASDDGLDVEGFPELFSAATEEEKAKADIALSDAVVSYAQQAGGSRVDPHTISRLIGEEPQVADPAVILARVSAAGEDAGEELRRFNPPQKAYEALREKLIELRRGRRAGRYAAIPTGPVLRLGMSDPRVPLVRARLGLEDWQDIGSQGKTGRGRLVYDKALAAAVADFQKANGLAPSGNLTARTVAALSGSAPSHVEAEILANMERWRWMPRDMGEKRIEVNIPDFVAAIIDNGQVIERVRVVTGKEQTPTPLLSGMMRYVIINPAWNVPQSIIRKEMLPRLAEDPDYFRRMGYEVFSRGGRLVVRQPPGERNALGRIKFVFPNDFSVYMHDTPMRQLFALAKRAFSHGCVRVDDPFRFAEAVLGRANGWSEERVKKMIGGRERYVYLPKPVPVHLEYFTAFIDESGKLQLRDDVYGYSRRVRAALGLEG